MGLASTIADPAWRSWAQTLPEIDRRNPQAFATYLYALERIIEDAPLDDDGLTGQDYQALLILLNSHRQSIARELLQAAKQSQGTTVPGAAAGLISALSATMAPLIAAGQLVLAVFGLVSETRQARLERLADRIDHLIGNLERRLK